MFNTGNMERAHASSVSQFMHKVYGWMALALTITAVTSYLNYMFPVLLIAMLQHRFLFYGLLIGQVVMVVYLSARIQKISFGQASLLFTLYSMLNGITMSVIFLVYQLPSIVTVFGITVGMFSVMAIYGYFTKADLTQFGQVMRMGLFGILIAMVVNMFLGNDSFSYVISFIAVLIFTGLTAYDTQKIKLLGSQMLMSGQSTSKIALMGALTLYLDFVNLFLHLLRLFGKRR